jgi:putative NADH-flavin reductase
VIVVQVVVFGASGGVGSQAVAAAVAQGMEVVAVARSRPAVPAEVESVAMDVRDAAAVQTVLRGSDAVLWCIGVTKRSGPDVGRRAMPHVVAAAQEHGVERLVSVSGAGVTLPGDNKPAGARLMSGLTRRLAADLVQDKEGEHAILSASSLSWTEVRPPRLVDREATGRWALVEHAPGLTAKPVTKADAALAMLELAGSRSWVRRSPFLVAA